MDQRRTGAGRDFRFLPSRLSRVGGGCAGGRSCPSSSARRGPSLSWRPGKTSGGRSFLRREMKRRWDTTSIFFRSRMGGISTARGPGSFSSRCCCPQSSKRRRSCRDGSSSFPPPAVLSALRGADAGDGGEGGDEALDGTGLWAADVEMGSASSATQALAGRRSGHGGRTGGPAVGGPASSWRRTLNRSEQRDADRPGARASGLSPEARPRPRARRTRARSSGRLRVMSASRSRPGFRGPDAAGAEAGRTGLAGEGVEPALDLAKAAMEEMPDGVHALAEKKSHRLEVSGP